MGSWCGAGVEIHEYCKRPLHGKVAVVDDMWATVGSSNLDPLSLSLNLEANVMIRDRAFAQELRANLEDLMAQHCRRLESDLVDAAPRRLARASSTRWPITSLAASRPGPAGCRRTRRRSSRSLRPLPSAAGAGR